ncbi:MAG: hypothetical protein HY589_05700, partial [Candidatus Omnitrophica bacterium]|nr:hypothetical protein [Candidatus Omnitrophota bacterium]
ALIPSNSNTGGGAIHIGGLDTGYKAEALVKFLQKYGKTNLLASPRIVTINNEEAKILVGTNQPYATSQTTTPATGAATTAYTITFLDLGTKLYVTPTINRAGFITMKIKPEVSSTSANYTYGANDDTVPIVSTSQAETTVMVKDGSTVVIAGLIENREEEEVKKVPGIGDVPLIGGAFRSRTKGSTTNPEKNELVIFLTPHIISGDVSSPEVEKYGLLTGKLERQLTQKELKEVPAPGAKVEQFNLKPQAEIDQKKEAPPEMSRAQYYNMVRQTVCDKIKENYPGQGVKGEVIASFCVSSDGQLKGEPALTKPVHACLKDATIKGIRASAPFPPFPKTMTAKQEMFKIKVVYE